MLRKTISILALLFVSHFARADLITYDFKGEITSYTGNKLATELQNIVGAELLF